MSDQFQNVIWIDGHLVSGDQPVVYADDSAFAEGRGCYTSVRIEAGRPRFADRHLRRLQQGARALRLGDVVAADVDRALSELAGAAFCDGNGVIRLQLSRRPGGSPQLVGVPRDLGIDHPEWSAISSPLRHAGEVLPGGHKLTNRVVLGLAGEQSAEMDADEALLFDSDDRLVEGARSNIVVIGSDGAASTPGPDSGAVSGIALQVALEFIPEISRRAILRSELDHAREIIALNSVRGARPITRLDGVRVGDGKPGAWAHQLAQAIARG